MFFFGTQCRMIVLPYGETIDTGALRTDRQTNRQTDGWTDRIAISISRVSVLLLLEANNICEFWLG